MGILSTFGRSRDLLRAGGVGGDPSRLNIVSPFAAASLPEFVYSDIFGAEYAPVTRQQAMTLPPVVNGRARIVGELAPRPLRLVRGGDLVDDQPAWLTRTHTDVSIWHRMAGTYDDWIFYGESLWTIQRGRSGNILDALRVPYDDWQVTDGRLELYVRPESGDAYWKTARAGEVLYLPGPFDGLLAVGSRTLRGAANLEASWANRAATPLPGIVISQKESGPLDPDEVQQLVDTAAAARRSPNGPVMFVPYEYAYEIVGDSDPVMLTEARNAYKLDVAGFLGLGAAEVDAALPKASLNYETEAGNDARFMSRLPYWTAPLEARLSMDDVCPRGSRIAFDFSEDQTIPGGDTGPFLED